MQCNETGGQKACSASQAAWHCQQLTAVGACQPNRSSNWAVFQLHAAAAPLPACSHPLAAVKLHRFTPQPRLGLFMQASELSSIPHDHLTATDTSWSAPPTHPPPPTHPGSLPPPSAVHSPAGCYPHQDLLLVCLCPQGGLGWVLHGQPLLLPGHQHTPHLLHRQVSNPQRPCLAFWNFQAKAAICQSL